MRTIPKKNIKKLFRKILHSYFFLPFSKTLS